MLKNCHVSGCKCPQQIIEVELYRERVQDLLEWLEL